MDNKAVARTVCHACICVHTMVSGLAGLVPSCRFNVLGKRAGHASERVKISPSLTLTINYTSKIEDIGKK